VKSLSLNEILQQIGGERLHGSGNPVIRHVMTRSKKEIEDYTLVFHLDRERIRGRYWQDNESIVIVSDSPEQCTDLGEHIVLIKVNAVKEAYWKFVDYYRNLFNLPVIGITGTCGKTSTKEMIKQILREDFHVKATWKSMNSKSVNLRYLLGIDDETDVAVFEMPVVYPGYLRISCRYFKPQIRILLNIGVHHLADCETPEEYMRAKAEIVEDMDPVNGTLILNADDDNIRKVVNTDGLQRVIYFGKSERADYRASRIRYADGGMQFVMHVQGETHEVFVPGYGEYNVYNALAAIAAVVLVGVDVRTAIKRLALIQQIEEHMEFKTGVNGCTVIDDTWNSSILSTTSGLQVLQDVSRSQGKAAIALLGYIPQLGEGEYAAREYANLGEKAAKMNVDLLVAIGEEAAGIGKGALEAGLDPQKVLFCTTGDELYEMVSPYLHDKAVILLEITHRVMKQPSFAAFKQKLIPDQAGVGKED
jgi:UDP-N-acetylmuramoyl-tripeptide--D-alanyl-D-alanine ligase